VEREALAREQLRLTLEVAYLLQRVENHHGLVILATNQRGNIDDAFTRRFHAIVHFPMPRPEDRYQIWRKAFPEQIKISEDIDWHSVAAQFELAGASILNITHYCALETLAAQTCSLNKNQLEAGILREYVKEGKVI
jgi:SpoVK/Ycf46/Vps4 family AAA+-type ATPase